MYVHLSKHHYPVNFVFSYAYVVLHFNFVRLDNPMLYIYLLILCMYLIIFLMIKVWTMDCWFRSFGHCFWLFATKLIVFFVNLSFGILIFQNFFSLDQQTPITEKGTCVLNNIFDLISACIASTYQIG